MSRRLSLSVTQSRNAAVRRELWIAAHEKWQINVLITTAGAVDLLIGQHGQGQWAL